MKLPQDANEAICDDTVREAECLEYMVASVAESRAGVWPIATQEAVS
jgi:hypothetical protein